MSFSPAFQFYPADWLSSLSITLMTPAEEGAYIRLLAHCWEQDDCGLPLEAFKPLSRLGDAFDASSERILKNFREENGRWYNDRLLEERKKQLKNREVRKKAGIVSGISRSGIGEIKIPDGLITPGFSVAWKGWLEYRAEKKKPVSAKAAEALLKRFEKIGADIAIAMIRQSIENDWQGIFELKEKNKPQNKFGPQPLTRERLEQQCEALKNMPGFDA